MLKLENVYKTFFPGSPNEKKALQGVSFTLEDGDFATVIGSNGAGKSTVLNSIAGVFPIDSGRIIIGDTDVTKMPEHKRGSFHRPRFPGSDEGNGSRHADCGESGYGNAPRPETRTPVE